MKNTTETDEKLRAAEIDTLFAFRDAALSRREELNSEYLPQIDLYYFKWLQQNKYARAKDIALAAKVSETSFSKWKNYHWSPSRDSYAKLLEAVADYAEGLAIEMQHKQKKTKTQNGSQGSQPARDAYQAQP